MPLPSHRAAVSQCEVCLWQRSTCCTNLVVTAWTSPLLTACFAGASRLSDATKTTPVTTAATKEHTTTDGQYNSAHKAHHDTSTRPARYDAILINGCDLCSWSLRIVLSRRHRDTQVPPDAQVAPSHMPNSWLIIPPAYCMGLTCIARNKERLNKEMCQCKGVTATSRKLPGPGPAYSAAERTSGCGLCENVVNLGAMSSPVNVMYAPLFPICGRRQPKSAPNGTAP